MSETLQKKNPQDIISNTLEQLEIRSEHSVACLEEIQYWLANTGLDDPELADLTKVPFVTIDNPDSRDLDQALHILRNASGYRVRYALADAAYYIRPGSELFKEALARGTTYYTPTHAAPMLPIELSEGLISLNPEVDRRALVFDMTVDSTGNVDKTVIVRAKIRSHAKLNYAGVQSWLDSGKIHKEPYDDSLALLEELGNKLIVAAEQRGVVKFDRTETKIQIEGVPPRFTTSVRERYTTERYNEQISLMCNMQGAEMLLTLEGVSNVLQAIYRVHEAPLKKSLKALRETLELFASQQNEPELWRWDDEQNLADFLENLPSAIEHHRKVKSVQRQIMQAQRGSSYEPDASEHHALKAASYARFSSPMREVVGIFTHKELLEALGGKAMDNVSDQNLRDEVIESATLARQKQRKLDKKIAHAALSEQFSIELATREFQTHEGTIMGLRKDRLYITLDDSALDIKVYKSDLNEQLSAEYDFNEVSARSSSPNLPVWTLGQAVYVRLSGFNAETQRYNFSLYSA